MNISANNKNNDHLTNESFNIPDYIIGRINYASKLLMLL